MPADAGTNHQEENFGVVGSRPKGGEHIVVRARARL